MIKIKQYKADASQLNDTPIITMFKIDLRCCQTIIQGVLQSSQPPLKICCISYNSEARTRTLQGILETQNYPCFFDCPYKAIIGNHPVMRKFRGTILNFHKSQNILKDFFSFLATLGRAIHQIELRQPPSQPNT